MSTYLRLARPGLRQLALTRVRDRLTGMVTTAYIGTRDDEMLSNATDLIEKAVNAYLDNAEAEKKEDKKSE